MKANLCAQTISVALLALLGAVPNALAQEPAAPAAEAAPESPDAPATAEPADEEIAEAVDEALPGPDDPLHWSKMRKVYTLQKRTFTKEGRFGVTVYGGLIPNNIFEQYFPVGIRLNYYMLENLGLELASSYAFTSKTNLEAVMKEERGINAQQILVGDTQVSHNNFGIVWSPFYGKISTYSKYLNYFDLYLFAGLGLVITESVPDFNAPPERGTKPEGSLGAGIAFYIGEHAVVRADFRQFAFQKVKGIGGVANPSEVSMGLGWFF